MESLTFLSEDPTFLAGLLGLLAASAFMALRVTQQGKYLYWALGALASAVGVVVIEYFWVTQNERLERVVYDLRRAVLASDVDGVLAHLTPDVEYVQRGTVLPGDLTRELIRSNLAHSSFDFIHISDLQVSAGRQTGRGKAEFRVYAKGTLQTSLARFNVGTANSTWSLGFEETEPKVWKVSRITPMSLPAGAISVPSSMTRGKTPGGDGREPPDEMIGVGRRFRPRGIPPSYEAGGPGPTPPPNREGH